MRLGTNMRSGNERQLFVRNPFAVARPLAVGTKLVARLARMNCLPYGSYGPTRIMRPV